MTGCWVVVVVTNVVPPVNMRLALAVSMGIRHKSISHPMPKRPTFERQIIQSDQTRRGVVIGICKLTSSQEPEDGSADVTEVETVGAEVTKEDPENVRTAHALGSGDAAGVLDDGGLLHLVCLECFAFGLGRN